MRHFELVSESQVKCSPAIGSKWYIWKIIMNNETLVNELTAKNENQAQKAAGLIVDEANTDAFSILVGKSEYLFDFVKANVNRRLKNAVNRGNYRGLIHFMSSYCSDFEDFVAGSLAKFADEDLTDEILELLESGSYAQKTYAAKYFSLIPDTVASEMLMDYAFDENESLAFNAAEALGAMDCGLAYNMALEMLKSDDDFVVLKAVKFLVAFGDKKAVPFILTAMKNSSMAENIAGEIPYLDSISALLRQKETRADVLFCMSKILTGLGEILPLNQIFSFEMYEVLENLVRANKSEKNGLISVVLLKALLKFETICENDEYTYDEDKNTKAELRQILSLLQDESEEFWDEQKELILEELSEEKERAISAAHLISELKIDYAAGDLKKLSESDDEILICESVLALKSINALDCVDKAEILSKIKDENKRAIVENCFA